MTFEAIVTSQEKNVFTVRQVSNGVIWQNVLLASNVLFCPAIREYVLCTRSQQGHVYIMAKIQGEWDDKYGFQFGDMTDHLTVTENGTLHHIKGNTETILDEDGFRAKYDKFELEGLGWKITCEDKKITLYTDATMIGEVIVDSSKIILAGGDGGGIPIGNNYTQLLNQIKDAINDITNMYNAHTHVATTEGSPVAPTTSTITSLVTSSPEQSSKVTCG